MLSDRLISLRDAIKARRHCLTEDNLRTIIDQLSAAVDDVKMMEAQVVSNEARGLPYSSNVINLAVILNRRGVTAGMPVQMSDVRNQMPEEGGAA